MAGQMKGKAPSWYWKNSNGSLQNSPATGGQYWQWGAVQALVLDDAAVSDYKAATGVAGKDLFLRLQSALDSNLAGAGLTITTGAKHGVGADGTITLDAGALWVYPQAHTANAGISLDSGLTVAATATLATGTALTAGLELATGAGGIVLDSAGAITLEATTTARVDCSTLYVYPAAGTANQYLGIDVDTLDTEVRFDLGSAITTGLALSWAGVYGLKVDDAAVAAYTAASDTAGKSVFIRAQSGGAHVAGNPAGASINLYPGAAGAGGSGAAGQVRVYDPTGVTDVRLYSVAASATAYIGTGTTILSFEVASGQRFAMENGYFYPVGANGSVLGLTSAEWKCAYLGEDTTTGPVSTSGLYLGLAQEARIRWNKDATSYPAACLILGLEAVGTAAKDVLALSGAAITGFANTVAATAGKSLYAALQDGGVATGVGLAGATGTLTAGAGSAAFAASAQNGGAGGGWALTAAAGGAGDGVGTGGAGGSITLTGGAGAAGTLGGAGGNIIAIPGAVGAGGSPTVGAFIVRQPGGVAGTDEWWAYSDGTQEYLDSRNAKFGFKSAGTITLDYGITYAGEWYSSFSFTVKDDLHLCLGTNKDWRFWYDETTTDALILGEASVPALAIKGSAITGFLAANQTDGNALFASLQDGGTTTSGAGRTGASCTLTTGAGSAGFAGSDNIGGNAGNWNLVGAAGGAAASAGVNPIAGGTGGGVAITLGAGGAGAQGGDAGTGGQFSITGVDSYTYTRLGVGTYNRAGIASTPTDALLLTNATAALVGAQVQMTPRLRIHGAAWNGTDTDSTDWAIDALPAAATPITSTLRFGHSLESAAYTYPMTIDNSGNLTVLGAISGASLVLTPTAALVGLTMTAALHTQTAGVIDLNCTVAATGVVGIDVSMTTPAAGLGIGESMYGLSVGLIGDAQDNAAAIVYGINFGWTANTGAATARALYVPATFTYSLYSLANIYMGASDIETDTTTGMMIGTAADQKIGHYGVTPAIQPAHVADPAACAANTFGHLWNGATYPTAEEGAELIADLAALKAAADANNAAIDLILAQLATLGLQASS